MLTTYPENIRALLAPIPDIIWIFQRQIEAPQQPRKYQAHLLIGDFHAYAHVSSH